MVTSGGVGSGRSTLVGIIHVCMFICGIFVCSSVYCRKVVLQMPAMVVFESENCLFCLLCIFKTSST